LSRLNKKPQRGRGRSLARENAQPPENQPAPRGGTHNKTPRHQAGSVSKEV